MRCVVARAVREFLLEPKSRSDGRSPGASDLAKKKGIKKMQKKNTMLDLSLEI